MVQILINFNITNEEEDDDSFHTEYKTKDDDVGDIKYQREDNGTMEKTTWYLTRTMTIFSWTPNLIKYQNLHVMQS